MPISDLLPWNREKAKYDLQRREDNQMMDMRHEMNALFEDFFAHPLNLASMRRMLEACGDFYPGMDISETENEFIITVDLPGMDEKDIHLAIEGRHLTLSGTRQREMERKDAAVHRMERCSGSFQRSIILPGEVDINKVEAIFSKGVLKVVIPKPSGARNAVKRIPIKNS